MLGVAADVLLLGSAGIGALGMGRVFFFQAEDGIRDYKVTGVQTCALPISPARFSATTDWPHFCESFAATVRAEISVPPPGGNGTMKVTGFAGQTCASTGVRIDRKSVV